ncbi:MAG TPA: single-stranded DNA-binding protein [Gammaproteobacteria bacterium]|nr:single-stranded DNA-binding protein [Gammaproteobacteria bacterium]|tara:strand:- start:56 stop:523 length:468 start_codon:yes stop_codon:yes gene_type:complete
MGNLNKATLIGRLGNDPEVRYSSNGNAMCNFSIATNETWRDKDSGEKQERTEWHRVVCYGRLAEVAGEYLTKGKEIYVEGRIQTRKWEDKEGIERYTTEIVTSNFQFLGGRDDGSSSQASAPDNTAATPQNNTPSKKNQPIAKSPADDFDEDIPF